MLNFIRADLYRLSKSKSFWITEGIILLLVILAVVSNGDVGVTLGDSTQTTGSLAEMTGFLAIQTSLSSMLLYYSLPLTKNTAVSVLATIFIPMGFAIARFSLPTWKFLEYLDFQGGLEMVTMTTFKTWEMVQPIFVGSLISLLLCLLAAHLVFKRQEL